MFMLLLPFGEKGEIKMTKRKKQVDGTVKEPSSQDIRNAIERLLKYVIAGIWSCFAFSIVRYGDTCLIAAQNAEPYGDRYPREIPSAGSCDSEMAFINKSGVPTKVSRSWLRERLWQYFHYKGRSVLIFLPTWLIEVLIADDFSEDWRQMALKNWKDTQNVHNLCEKCQGELRDSNPLKAFTVGGTRSAMYIDDYLLTLKTITAATVVQTGMDPIEIRNLVIKGQQLSAESPDGFVYDGVSDAWQACSHLGLTPEALDEALNRSPEIFETIGYFNS
jgi:hypothetical protein